MSDGSMTRDEREAFVRDLHLAILAVDEPGRGPLALPVWYLVDDGGDLLVSMDGASRKAELIRAAGRVTMTVQTEDAPYRYASVEGPATVGPVTHDPLALAARYLGPELGAWYVEHNPTTDTTVTVTVRPERWRTHDFAKDR